MEQYLPYVGGIILALITFFLGKKKYLADTQKTELDSVDKAVKIWRELAQDMTREMEGWKLLANKLQEEVDDLRGEIKKLVAENERLNMELDRLSKLINNKKNDK